MCEAVSTPLLDEYAEALYSAWRDRTPISPLRNRSALTLADAYQIQQGFIRRRLDAGEQIVGKKIGVTSKAVQDMLKVKQPDFGQLLSGMVRADGGTIDISEMIQPRAEAELAFKLSRDLCGPGVTAVDVIAATEWVAPCIEVVDSRIKDWDIGIIDTVADNASCGVFVIGEATAHPLDVDLNLAGMVVRVDGEVVTTGAGAAVQHGPANAVAWLANTLGALGMPFLAGEVILSGSQSVLLPMKAGMTFTCTVGGLGSCSVRFEEGAA